MKRRASHLSRQQQIPITGSTTSSQQTRAVTLLARQVKQIKKQREVRQLRHQVGRPKGQQIRDAKNGSWPRSIVLVAIACTGVGLMKVVHDPQVSADGVRPNLRSRIDIPTPERMLPDVAMNQIDLDFIKHLEGFHSTPYDDGTQRSWGYGTKAGTGSITREQAEEEMKAYLQQHCLPILPAGLPDHKATALASFCYNLGPDQAQQTTLWKAALRGRTVNFLGYTRSARGVSLLSRRRKEQARWDGQ